MAETLLDRLLAPGALSVVFQPIIEYRKGGWRLHAVEALIRGPRGTHMESPEVLFEYVRRKDAAPAMDRRCVAEVLRAARPLGPSTVISLNVHAATLEKDPGFPEFLGDQVRGVGRASSQVIVEIVEHVPPSPGPGLARTLEGLRQMGFATALDDIGLGQSNFRMILECRPQYFKIDSYLVVGAHRDYYRRAVLRSIAGLAASFGGTAIAEGVESAADLQTVLGEGVSTVQGFLLARPAAARHGDWLQLGSGDLPNPPPLAAAG